MTTWLPRCFACLVLLLPFIPVVAIEPDDKDIDRLIRQLGSDSFSQREAASARLKQIGEPALAALRKAATESGDVEVRSRAAALVRPFQDRLDRTDCASVPPPKGAIVLFDGKDLQGWVHRDGKSEPAWRILEGGVLEPRGGDVMTRRTFTGSFKLHVEFRVPHMPRASGQARGNSGVYMQGRYELQILDSHGLPADAGGCGAVYGLVAPRVNACKAPEVWQSYDVEFHPPKFRDGRKTEDVRLTVFHNGVKIHDDVRFGKVTGSALPGDLSGPGPILLQDHGNPVQFRNLWLLPLGEKGQP